MKKDIFIILTAGLMLLTSCGQADSDQEHPPSVSSDISSELTAVPESEPEGVLPDSSDDSDYSPFNPYKTFMDYPTAEKLLNDNPIDKSFLQDEMPGSTADIIYFYGKYIEFWQAELDNIISILTEILSPDSLELFEESQNHWEEYLHSEIPLGSEVYLDIMGQGSIMGILSAERDLQKTRERTLELAEYCIFITGDYEFVFER